MQDTYIHQGQRKRLVEEIKNKGIVDEKILDVIGKIPRHYFLEPSLYEFAYKDIALQIGEGQTISQPYTVARQTELLEITPGMKVLEIGTGSGYQALVLLELGMRVYSIERHLSLHQKAKKMLENFGYAPKLIHGDGFKGMPTYAPFDRIIVTAAAPEVPQNLLKQLKIKGKMVIPVDKDKDDTQEMRLITKIDEVNFKEEFHGMFRFVPMLKDKK